MPASCVQDAPRLQQTFGITLLTGLTGQKIGGEYNYARQGAVWSAWVHVLIVAVLVLMACLFITTEGNTQGAQEPPGILDQFSNALKLLSDGTSSAVVQVQVSGYGKADDDDDGPGTRLVVK